jgi:hypothetical protein
MATNRKVNNTTDGDRLVVLLTFLLAAMMAIML